MDLGASDDAQTQLLWRLVRAKLLARRGRHDEAARLLAEALAIAHSIQHPHDPTVAEVDAAEVHTLAGRREEARNSLLRGLDLARAKGNLPMTAHVEELLAASQRGERSANDSFPPVPNT